MNSSVCQPGLIGIKALKPYAKSDRISQVLESTNFCPRLILRSFKWTLGKKRLREFCVMLCTDRSLVIPLTRFFQFSHGLKTF